VDSAYRGEIKVILINHGNDTYYVHAGDRVAQLVIARHETAICQESAELAESVRGSNGFGSTGRS
jgi:dUTP pyrophosphatase